MINQEITGATRKMKAVLVPEGSKTPLYAINDATDMTKINQYN